MTYFPELLAGFTMFVDLLGSHDLCKHLPSVGSGNQKSGLWGHVPVAWGLGAVTRIASLEASTSPSPPSPVVSVGAEFHRQGD